ncbi:DNA-processing protein DprA [Chitinophaga horti]|uniref:DNA-processing protein DprA n=1 Tax=Chitinophaga horti TaxID=2920382 RepID=A0ABY6J4G5_9BACT|nr:DNA-processing protein DprA [Chitinophaga horti]UYQ93517.1 DNA-processing protein DprA [Chitinophaga horti]
MTEETRYQLALTLIPQIGDIVAKDLLADFESASAIFKAKITDLERTNGIGKVRANAIKYFSGFARATKEMEFMSRYHIQPLFITDPRYPQRLRHCIDAPIMLYYKGNADLNASRMVNVIGTRSPSPYGAEVCRQLVKDLAGLNVTIVSGLAYGIDVLAHKAAMDHHTPTIGILAHGLDRMYPPAHHAIAKQMLQQGGLLTDFMSGTQPDKQNFPRRNRIVAGMCDATIVIESGEKGGSLITADIASSYNRDVAAIPGRINDERSSGCLQLIKTHKAALITSAQDLVDLMGWDKQPGAPIIRQKEIFIDLNSEEQRVVDLFQHKKQLHIDEIYRTCQLPGSQLATTLLNLEIQAVIKALPGNCYILT